MTRIAEWKIRLYPFEEDGTTKAGVVPTRERPCSPAKQVAHCDSAAKTCRISATNWPRAAPSTIWGVS